MRVLVVDDEKEIARQIRAGLESDGYPDVDVAHDIASARKLLQSDQHEPYGAIVVDWVLPARLDDKPDESGGPGFVAELRGAGERKPRPYVIMISALPQNAPEAIAAGADVFLPKPVISFLLVACLMQAARRQEAEVDQTRELIEVLAADKAGNAFVATGLEEVIRVVNQVARLMSSVLITGETGTGKELIAYALHKLSPRAKMPYVAANCAGLSETLADSQLFGHKKGAFTGAHADHRGYFESAQGGTILLDEVGDLPLSVQSKLLRALQERTIRPLGAERDINLNVRVISATKQPLDRLVADGRFRDDLFYRLNVVRIEMPTLRQRPGAIAEMARTFYAHFRAELGAEERLADELPPALISLLESREWKGNARGLSNAIESAVARASGTNLTPAEFVESAPVRSPEESIEFYAKCLPAFPCNFAHERDNFIDALIRQALCAGGNQSQASKLLNMNDSTLNDRVQKMRERGISL